MKTTNSKKSGGALNPAQQSPTTQTRTPEPEQARTDTDDIRHLDFDLRKSNRALPADAVLAILRANDPAIYERAALVGKWIWVTFPERQAPAITSRLSQLGFHWNGARQTWQHPGGTASSAPMRKADPAEKYSITYPADLDPVQS